MGISSTDINKDINQLAADWYRNLDRHVPVEELLPYLVEAGLVMKFPEGTMRERSGFTEWYKTVTGKFFDESHSVKEVTAAPAGDGMRVKVVVNWQARKWSPPDANSVWLGFDAYQTWQVRPASTTRGWAIAEYVVDELRAMPGSAAL